MAIQRTTTARTAVRVTHSGRGGITVGVLRKFVAEADEAGIPDDERVRFEDRLGEGANRFGHVEASFSQPVEQ